MTVALTGKVHTGAFKGIDSDNCSEFINNQLLRYCQEERITFARSRSGNRNDGAHLEEKNWSVVRKTVGYHRYDTAQTPYQRVLDSPRVTKNSKAALTHKYWELNPAQVRREMLDLQDQLLDLVRAKHQPNPPASQPAGRYAGKNA